MDDAVVTVTNLMGQSVHSRVISGGGSHEISLEGAPGIYYVELIEGQRKKVFKVIKR